MSFDNSSDSTMAYDNSDNFQKMQDAELRRRTASDIADQHNYIASSNPPDASDHSIKAMEATQRQQTGGMEKLPADLENRSGGGSQDSGSSLGDYARIAKEKVMDVANYAKDKFSNFSGSSKGDSKELERPGELEGKGSTMQSAKNELKDVFGGGAGGSDSQAARFNMPQRSDIASDTSMIGHDDRLDQGSQSNRSNDFQGDRFNDLQSNNIQGDRLNYDLQGGQQNNDLQQGGQLNSDFGNNQRDIGNDLSSDRGDSFQQDRSSDLQSDRALERGLGAGDELRDEYKY